MRSKGPGLYMFRGEVIEVEEGQVISYPDALEMIEQPDLDTLIVEAKKRWPARAAALDQRKIEMLERRQWKADEEARKREGVVK